MAEKKKKGRRKTTALDRAVLRYQERGKQRTFARIYHEIYPTVRFVANRFAHLFHDRTIEDLMQDAYIHVSMKVIPAYDPEVSGFKTLVRIAVTNKFRTMVKEIMRKVSDPAGIPVITFTEWEVLNTVGLDEIPGGQDIFNEILVGDFLDLFKERLTKESWSIYWKMYRDPNSPLKHLAKEMGISAMSLYRKSRSIYSFLKMLVEKEASDG